MFVVYIKRPQNRQTESRSRLISYDMVQTWDDPASLLQRAPDRAAGPIGRTKARAAGKRSMIAAQERTEGAPVVMVQLILVLC